MSHWETILDKSSHVSPVKIVPLKNHSAERVEQYLKAMSTQPTLDQTEIHRKCQQDYASSSYTCTPAHYFPSPYTLLQEHIWNQHWIAHTRHNTIEWIYRSHMYLQPYTETLDAVNDWVEKTTIGDLMDVCNQHMHQLVYTADGKLRVLEVTRQVHYTYLLPWWTSTKTWTLDRIHQWRKELDDYVESGQTTKEERVPTEDVEDKLRKTAKRILEYIDQKSQESKKMGMKQEEAKVKAQEIIKNIMQETEKQAPEPLLLDFENTMDRVAFEIQSIMETAAQQKVMLNKQLDLIQERIKTLDRQQDLSFLVNALKAEVDQLRVIAENSVRERTQLALSQLEEMQETNPSVQSHIKRDFQTAQHAALKDLREAYIKLYQTNQEIDQLAISVSTES
ncbi:hypothetical protein A0J61_05018 [Choanephora cucurbitarum]|uniref:Uncharacterized protein n=1 Tax=Choanephora cucurbitarum TaxID=101091 RepID=A0A1C7NCV2_9FUNG|nr:hypothetical protein A0J61_05018 [Choanephora cucurbitarum]